jgi:hypothetical protein
MIAIPASAGASRTIIVFLLSIARRLRRVTFAP